MVTSLSKACCRQKVSLCWRLIDKLKNMASNIYWINEKKIGERRLATMARPRGNDWLEDEIKWFKTQGVDHLISLLEDSEIEELKLFDEAKLCEKWNVRFTNFPIKDINTPKNETAFLNLVEKLAQEIKEGGRVVVHCRMGIGRSSVLAAAIMIKLGFEAGSVFDIIGKYRNLKVPDTDEQKEWVLKIEQKLKS